MSVTGLLILSPGSLDVILICCPGTLACPAVTVAVAVLVDVPSATIDGGFSASVSVSGACLGGAAIASVGSPHQLRHVDRRTAPTRYGIKAVGGGQQKALGAPRTLIRRKILSDLMFHPPRTAQGYAILGKMQVQDHLFKIRPHGVSCAAQRGVWMNGRPE